MWEFGQPLLSNWTLTVREFVKLCSGARPQWLHFGKIMLFPKAALAHCWWVGEAWANIGWWALVARHTGVLLPPPSQSLGGAHPP